MTKEPYRHIEERDRPDLAGGGLGLCLDWRSAGPGRGCEHRHCGRFGGDDAHRTDLIQAGLSLRRKPLCCNSAVGTVSPVRVARIAIITTSSIHIGLACGIQDGGDRGAGGGGRGDVGGARVGFELGADSGNGSGCRGLQT